MSNEFVLKNKFLLSKEDMAFLLLNERLCSNKRKVIEKAMNEDEKLYVCSRQ